MARTNDINSATSQFFVNLVDNDFLDTSPATTATPCSAASTDGMDVDRRDRRASRPAVARAYDDVPLEDCARSSPPDESTTSRQADA